MRIHVLSDLHLEFGPYEAASIDADCVVLAGDIALATRGVEWAAEHFRGTPIVYVPGNHEPYKHALPDLTGKLREVGTRLGVHVLADEAVVIGGVRFLGATLWTDLRLFGNPALAGYTVQQRMNDYKKIRISPEYRRLRPGDTVAWHVRSRRWLEAQLQAPHDGPTMVVTHHAPSRRCLDPAFADDEVSAAYASDLDELVAGSGAAYWVSGHTHFATRFHLGATEVVSNPRGYADQPVAGFDPALVLAC